MVTGYFRIVFFSFNLEIARKKYWLVWQRSHCANKGHFWLLVSFKCRAPSRTKNTPFVKYEIILFSLRIHYSRNKLYWSFKCQSRDEEDKDWMSYKKFQAKWWMWKKCPFFTSVFLLLMLYAQFQRISSQLSLTHSLYCYLCQRLLLEEVAFSIEILK